MKKTIMTIAIILGLSLTTFAEGGGVFQRGAGQMGHSGSMYDRETTHLPDIPQHEPTAPLGSGIAVLTALGAAYLVGKKRREE